MMDSHTSHCTQDKRHLPGLLITMIRDLPGITFRPSLDSLPPSDINYMLDRRRNSLTTTSRRPGDPHTTNSSKLSRSCQDHRKHLDQEAHLTSYSLKRKRLKPIELSETNFIIDKKVNIKFINFSLV